MAEDKIINIRIQHKKDTSANWESVNPILKSGEIGFDELGRGKVGDGETHWNNLPYINNDIQTLSPIGDTDSTQFIIDDVVYTIDGNTITDDASVPNSYQINNHPHFIIDSVFYTINGTNVNDGVMNYPINDNNQFSIGTAPNVITYTINTVDNVPISVTDDISGSEPYPISSNPYFNIGNIIYTIDETTNIIIDEPDEANEYLIGNIYTISPENVNRIFYYTITKNTILKFESVNNPLFFVEKRIYLTNVGENAISLALGGIAEWANDAIDVEWGNPGMHIYLQATWIDKRIIVEVIDNDQLGDDALL